MRTFSELLATVQADGGTASLELSPDWLQGRTAFGGWQAALAVLAMRRQIGEQIPLRTLQCNFIAPVGLGPATARAEVLRRGKSATQIEARIVVDGRLAFQALGIFGLPRPSQIVESPRAPASVRQPEDVTAEPFIEGVTPQYTRHFDLRWGAGSRPYSGAAHSVAQIFVRFRGEDLESESHLIAIGDAIPPAAISLLKEPAMLSSMNWTLEMVTPLGERARAGWLRFDADLTAACDGYAWENVSIWSDEGELVALSRQCIAVFG
jgi:acyl-CoA thioesterase